MEIRKIQKSGGATYPSTDSVKMTVEEEVKSKALEELNQKISSGEKAEEKVEKSSTSEKELKTSDKKKDEENSLEEDEEELVLILEPDDPAKTKIKGEKSSKKKSSKYKRLQKRKLTSEGLVLELHSSLETLSFQNKLFYPV